MPAAVSVATASVPSQEFHTSFGSFRVLETCQAVAPAVRERALSGQCKDFRYYEIIEQTMPGQFKYRYLLLEHAETGEVAVQPFFLAEQDMLAGLPERLRRPVVTLRKRWPGLLTLRMLMVGCAAAEGQPGSAASWFAPALHEALELYRPHSGAAIILLKDFPAEYRAALAPFSGSGYRRVPSMPAAQLELDFSTFEDFLQKRLSKVFRKNLRRKFRALDGVPPVTMEVVHEAEGGLADELHALYLQTHLRSTMRFEQLTPEFFRELGRRMPDRVRFFLWRQSGRLIAFNFSMVHDGTLYDMDVGLDYAVALDLHLYFVTWRDMIQWALQNGLRRYHTGPLNYDPKLHLRLQLAPLDLYARYNSRWINPIFKVAIAWLQPARHDPVLKQFANAHELV